MVQCARVSFSRVHGAAPLQEVAFKVEPDGTVVDAQTGETMGMVDLFGAPSW